MVEPGEMEQAVQDKHLDLGTQWVPLLASLAKSRWHAHGKVSLFLALEQGIGWEGQDIRGFILAAKLTI